METCNPAVKKTLGKIPQKVLSNQIHWHGGYLTKTKKKAGSHKAKHIPLLELPTTTYVAKVASPDEDAGEWELLPVKLINGLDANSHFE